MEPQRTIFFLSVVRTLETFQGTDILGASRGLLCDSSAVLLLLKAQSWVLSYILLTQTQTQATKTSLLSSDH